MDTAFDIVLIAGFLTALIILAVEAISDYLVEKGKR